MQPHRHSGILLHPTSLPGPQAVGALGREAYKFIDFLFAAKQSVWQLLPLGPIGHGNCPYSSYSAFAGEPLLISLELLSECGDLDGLNLPDNKASIAADYHLALQQQEPLLRQAAQRFKESGSAERHQAFADFCRQQQFWLPDYTLFQALHRHFRTAWQQWPAELRGHQAEALQQAQIDFKEEIYLQQYLQFVFFEQWFALKRYANRQGIRIYGDLPIFVAENSADVWAHQSQYFLDAEGRPTLVAGVPPDYFSATGQRWGNPLYNWDAMRGTNFSWWQRRFEWNFALFDLVRVDHFRGFSACWSIPAHEPTAQNGYWQETPGRELFQHLTAQLGDLPIIAEDLGIITADVESLRDDFHFPGMKILQFAFDSDACNPYLPHNHIPNCVVYTGTHDNDTTLGWWHNIEPHMRERVARYLQQEECDMPWTLIQTALASVADMTIIPLQDILCLPQHCRMNIPGTVEHNWKWRFLADNLTPYLSEKLKETTQMYGRELCIPA